MPRGERPLDAEDGPLVRFAAELRRLRKKAGTPSYRDLAAVAHYSATSLSEAAGGRKLPSLAVTLAYVQACGGDADEWERRWRELAAELAADRQGARADGEQAPYVGLAAFQPEDSDLFFGREELLETLWTRLSERRLVMVVGASGAGKSSLLRAGLVPRLRAERRTSLLFTPGRQPLQECAARLAALTGGAAGRLYDELAGHSRNLGMAVAQVMAGRPERSELVLVVDQFEEVFTLCADEGERERFVDALAAAGETDGRCRVVLGVRADFYGHCTRYPALLRALQRAQVTVGPMTMDELRRAVTQPAVRAGYVVENDLLATLMAHAGGRPGVLPLLGHALLETWRRRRGTSLALSGFEAAGRIDGALAQTAETIHLAFSARQQTVARDLFVRLTALGEGTEDTKRQVGWDELDADDPDLAVVLERMAAARLITLDRNTVDITHEALIQAWPRLRNWLAEDRDALRAHRRLTEAAEAWEVLDRDPGALYRGARLALAADLAARGHTVLSARERAFLDESAAAEEHEHAASVRRTRRLRRLVVALSVLLLATAGLTGYAVRNNHTITQQRNTAVSQKLAAQATALRATSPALAAQLSLAAYRIAPTTEARSSLLSSLAAPHATMLTSHTSHVNAVALHRDGRTLVTGSADGTARIWDIARPHRPVESATLARHLGPVTSVATDPRRRIVATGSADHTLLLWDIGDATRPKHLATVIDHVGRVDAVAFSPDGTLLASVGADRTLRLHDVTDPGFPQRVAAVGGQVDAMVALAFSPDGRTLAASGWGDRVLLWDLADLAAPRELPGHTGSVVAVAFSPDGGTLASASQDQTVRLWRTRDFTERAMLPHDDVVRAVAFSPDGRTLATAGNDRIARLWSLDGDGGGRELMTLTGHTGFVAAVAFRDEGTLITGSEDHTARLWTVPGPVLAGHTDSVYGLAIHPDGRTVATAGRDRTVRLWDVSDAEHPRQTAVATAHPDIVRSVEFSMDGKVLATTSHDRTVRLWRVAGGHLRRLSTLDDRSGVMVAAAFSPDGRTLATASEDGIARLWDITDPGAPRLLAEMIDHTDKVVAVAFSPDGRGLATGSADRTARLWDTSDRGVPRRVAVLIDHVGTVTSVRYSPDGRLLATASADRTVGLWDIGDPDRPRRIALAAGHTDAVYSAVFRPDGRLLATASADRTVRLWDLRNPARPVEQAALTGHTEGVSAAAFRPDGGTLVTISHDRTARLWRTDPEWVADRVCALAHPVITEEEWAEHLPDLPFRPPCPAS
ncbi:hypothetical protein ACQPZF_19890 [Actinosynnema sp. CS-041913]|uniref:nSTAND1 domain-containing NTPase n=1 Tax=Actinosynnema sp. CS-041913 TaxID=3239917 RepID=UPI003D8A9A11